MRYSVRFASGFFPPINNQSAANRYQRGRALELRVVIETGRLVEVRLARIVLQIYGRNELN